MEALREQTFQKIAGLMYETVGLSFASSKKPLVSSRLASRVQRLGFRSFDEYFELIAGDEDGGEFQMAVDLLTTNETYFFREPAHFELLADDLTRRRIAAPTLWSAACSFGDEVYTLAMVLADLQQQGRISENWSILGTDISDRVLRSAAEGIFPQDRLREIPVDRRRRYCLKGEGGSEGLVQMRPVLTKHVHFGQLNLCRPFDGLGPFDAVFLRNVLIYFDAATKCEVMDRVMEPLRAGGLIFIGTAEGRVPCKTPIQSVAPGVFRKL